MNTHIKFDAYLSRGGKMTKRDWNLAGRPTCDTPFVHEIISKLNGGNLRNVDVPILKTAALGTSIGAISLTEQDIEKLINGATALK